MQQTYFDSYALLSWLYIPIGLYRLIRQFFKSIRSLTAKTPNEYTRYMFALKNNINMTPEMVAVYRWGCSQYEGNETWSVTGHLEFIKENLTYDGLSFNTEEATDQLRKLGLINEQDKEKIDAYFHNHD